ncbi:hypothetical protein [Paenibacillus chungangensis]|uniref:Uncharacterized protein n=1 Tax=Paenibacillus chungangensis TaxID=696535 RepID=A0ABW3HQZ3_9BACL
MTLPVELASIFHNKRKSYKMVLIQSILDEYRESYTRFLPLDQVAERFLSYYQKSSVEGKKVDSPPNGVASSWDEFTLSQTKSLLKTPIDALSKILEITAETITFRHHIGTASHKQKAERTNVSIGEPDSPRGSYTGSEAKLYTDTAAATVKA